MGRVDQRFHIRREYQSLYGIGLVLGAFVAGEAVGGDGFLAAFAAGLAVTAFNQTLCDCFLDFGQVIAEMTMLLAFVLFGALLSTLVGEVPLLADPGLGRAGHLRDPPGGRPVGAAAGPGRLEPLCPPVHRLVRPPRPQLPAVRPAGGRRRRTRRRGTVRRGRGRGAGVGGRPRGHRHPVLQLVRPQDQPADPGRGTRRDRRRAVHPEPGRHPAESLHPSWPNAWPGPPHRSCWMSAAARSTTATASASPAASGSCPTRSPSGRPTASATSPMSCTAPDRGSRPAPGWRCSSASSASRPRRSRAA